MRNMLLATLLLLPFLSSALTKADVYKTGPITWLGVDFTRTVINQPDAKEEDLINKFIPDWNDIILREPDKYKFNKTFHRGNMIMGTEVAFSANSTIKQISIQGPVTSEASLPDQVKSYDFSGKIGIGCMLVMIEMNKEKKTATGYLVFVDMSNHEILDVRFVEGRAGGFGIRNYWANAIANIFEYTASHWQKWRKEVLGK